jgi:hypothetical protein
MFKRKFCRESRNAFYVQWSFFRKLYRLWDNVVEYSRAGEATGDDIIRSMRTASWRTKATDTHPKFVMVINFPRQESYANASQCYVVRSLPACSVSLRFQNVLVLAEKFKGWQEEAFLPLPNTWSWQNFLSNSELKEYSMILVKRYVQCRAC